MYLSVSFSRNSDCLNCQTIVKSIHMSSRIIYYILFCCSLRRSVRVSHGDRKPTMQEDKNIILRQKLWSYHVNYFIIHWHSNSVAHLCFFTAVTALWWIVMNALNTSSLECLVVFCLLEVMFCVDHGMCVTGLNRWLSFNMHMLTAVESLEARVISRFPFMPNTAGTRMKISVISWNTSQFWKHSAT